MNGSAGEGAGAKPGAADPAGTGVGQRHVVVVGFGLSGRTVTNAAIEGGISYVVIETNPATVERCAPGGLHIIEGDARDPDVLRRAGIERATDVAVTVPQDDVTLEVVEQARNLNPGARIIARCAFVSGGIEAQRRGADETVIAEQLVAADFARAIAEALDREPPAAQEG